jgi:hypothetical protein
MLIRFIRLSPIRQQAYQIDGIDDCYMNCMVTSYCVAALRLTSITPLIQDQ